MKQPDPFYNSKEWQALRTARLVMDNYTCVVPGCNERATVVDHIKSRRSGGADSIANTRSLCRTHDCQVMQKPDGTRKSGGVFKVIGCGVDGWPRGVVAASERK